MVLPGRAPARRAAEGGHARRVDRPAVRVDVQVGAADEIEPRVIEIVVREVVDARPLARKPVPVADIVREEGVHLPPLVVAEIVSADLPVVVGEALREGLRTGQPVG